MSISREDVLLAVYERNAKMNEVFIEWRNKLLVFGTSGIAVMIGAAEYAGTHDRAVAWIPGAVGAVIGAAVALCDVRNGSLLAKIYDTGKRLETDLGVTGFYSNFNMAAKIKYGHIIKAVGITLGAASLTLGIVWSVG